ncbi:hemolysin regulation protein AhpA [Rodentibacter caecimuris]|uniref:Hemolysin regulation protein AhpA n=2 Tax=Rodentibacter caecimuris TaxID=1796644 RepID=A0ABX3KZE0_9PAST|nr:hemolysin regulation protein AhpA [Rodentibacter heylii]
MLVIIIILTAGAFSAILYGVKQFKIGSQLSSINQVSNLSHILVRQQANLFSMLLGADPKLSLLIENLDNFTKEDFVIEAAIYNKYGELLAQSSNAGNLREQLGLAQTQTGEIIEQQIVEPIYTNSTVEGFLRVTFDSRYGQTTQNKINQLFYHLYGELIIVFLLGALAASSIHYFLGRYRRILRHHHSIQDAQSSKKTKNTASLNFHRRRRRV